MEHCVARKTNCCSKCQADTNALSCPMNVNTKNSINFIIIKGVK